MKQSIILILLNCCRLDCLLTKALFPFDIAKIGSLFVCDYKKSHKNFILWLFIDLNQNFVCAHSTFLLKFHPTKVQQKFRGYIVAASSLHRKGFVFTS